jgi:hypothetical protein
LILSRLKALQKRVTNNNSWFFIIRTGDYG